MWRQRSAFSQFTDYFGCNVGERDPLNCATDTITVTYSGGGIAATAGADVREHDNGDQCPFGGVAAGGAGPATWVALAAALLLIRRRRPVSICVPRRGTGS